MRSAASKIGWRSRFIALFFCAALLLLAAYLMPGWKDSVVSVTVQQEVQHSQELYERLSQACRLASSETSGSKPCEGKLQRAIPAVACEVRLGLGDAYATESERSPSRKRKSCVPTIRRINCSELAQSGLPCAQPFTIEEYDYHTQHHCIEKLVATFSLNNETIPRLLHYIWYYPQDQGLEFHSYLGISSTVRFLKARAVFLWNDGNLPKNQWWQELIARFNQPPNVEVITTAQRLGEQGKLIPTRKIHLFGQTKVYSIYRRRPTHIYGNPIDQEYHRSDVVRLDALLLYGGLYIDTDVVSVRDLSPLLTHQVVMGREASATVPTIGNAIIFAKHNASYLNIWHHTYTTFNPSEWGAHSTVGNNLLANECPNFVHIEDDSLMKPGDHGLLYYRDASLASNYMLHLWMRWRGDNHPVQKPEDLINWSCTVGRILRGLYFGSCDVCG